MICPDELDLTRYDKIVLNTSGGKDSALMCWYVAELARGLEISDRVVAVHATFKEEWPGTVSLIERQLTALGGIPLHVVKRRRENGQEENLLDYVRRRGMWPSSSSRYCTSDFKRGPCRTVWTKVAPGLRRRARVLNVMGMRAAEGPFRKNKMRPIMPAQDNERRVVTNWLPIYRLSTPQVYALNHSLGLEMHPAYAAGMPRLSCRFCIFAPPEALMIAGRLNPELLAEYVEVERQIGHAFKMVDKKPWKIATVQEDIAAGIDYGPAADWRM